MMNKREHTILIVDDSPDDVEITRIVLSNIGRNVAIEEASRGEAALARLRKGKMLPSVILLDLKMPGMSGFDFLREIRSDKRLEHIPVIVVTASSLKEDETESYTAGADGFLQKAFNIEEFSRDLRSLLDRWLK